MTAPPPPRLFGIPATHAPVVAVFRRGPSDWSHVGRWDIERGVYEPGSWIHANLYPQRADLSPDGRWLSYFALKSSARWAVGGTYIALSRLPWLTALAAWPTCGTWTCGAHFVEERRTWEPGAPQVGNVGAVQRKFGIAWTRAATFAVERRRGWAETEDTPPRSPNDVWDQHRRVAMEKKRPGTRADVRLVVRGYYAAFRSTLPGAPKDVDYTVVERGRTRPVADAQWADWSLDGRLLVATRDGRLQVRDTDAVTFDVDLATLAPAPTPPPAEASVW